MANPYTTQAISGYNSSPPEDDGSQVSTNEIKWSTHKTKLGDPVKTLAEAINTETLAAFGLTFGQTISTHSTAYTVVAADRGKFLSVTGTTTITLIAVASAGDGFPLATINTGTGIVTVDGSGAETINGSATIELSPGESLLLTCNGSLWIGSVIGRDSAKGADIASATTTDIGAATGDFVDITGTTTITGLGTAKAGTKRTVQFDGALTLTHNATSLILPGNANISVKAGDIAEFVSLGSGNWIMTNYLSESTTPLIETGTWTPVLWDDTLSSGEGQTYSAQQGNYTKIGNRIFFSGKIIVTSLGTLTTAQGAKIGGLPFTSSSSTNVEGSVYFGKAVGTTKSSSTSTWLGHIDENTNYFDIYDWESASATTTVLISEITANGHLVFAGQYLV